MRNTPLPNEPLGGAGFQATDQILSVKREGRLLPLEFCVKMRQSVFAVEHPDHDAEEG